MDYVIVMGFMDYMPDPEKVVAKRVLSLTLGEKRSFFFPGRGWHSPGWQRKIRYQKRCKILFLGTPGAPPETYLRQLSGSYSQDRTHQPRLLRYAHAEWEDGLAAC